MMEHVLIKQDTRHTVLPESNLVCSCCEYYTLYAICSVYFQIIFSSCGMWECLREWLNFETTVLRKYQLPTILSVACAVLAGIKSIVCVFVSIKTKRELYYADRPIKGKICVSMPCTGLFKMSLETIAII